MQRSAVARRGVQRATNERRDTIVHENPSAERTNGATTRARAAITQRVVVLASLRSFAFTADAHSHR